MTSYGVSIDVEIVAVDTDIDIETMAQVADSLLVQFGRQHGAASTDMSGSASTGKYTFRVVVQESDATDAAVKATALLRSAASAEDLATPVWPLPEELHVSGVRVHQVVTA